MAGRIKAVRQTLHDDLKVRRRTGNSDRSSALEASPALFLAFDLPSIFDARPPQALDPSKDWSFVLRQIGMFSFTGLAPEQVENMTAKWHVYMTKDGRISLAGLNQAKCKYLANAIVESFKVPVNAPKL